MTATAQHNPAMRRVLREDQMRCAHAVSVAPEGRH
jgi:hypothetical protein